MKYFFILMLLPIIFSCKKDPFDNEYIIKSAPTRLCISGFVSSDSIYVVLSRNLPRDFDFSGGNPYLINDTIAEINVYENEIFFCKLQPLSLLKDSGTSNPYLKVYYTSHKKATEGNTYNFEVLHRDYESISAKTTMPYKVPVISVDTFTFFKHVVYTPSYLDNITQKVDTFIQFTMFTINFQDPPDTLNYYLIEIFDVYASPNYNLNDPIIEYKKRGCLFTDKLIQGKKYGLQYSIQTKYADSLLINLYSVNLDFYKYRVSIDKFLSMSQDQYQEPTLIFSNVKNGFGIIGGYMVSSKRIDDQK